MLPTRTRLWEIDPRTTALLNIDLQNDFLDEQGHYRSIGVDTTHMRRVIDPVTDLIAAARSHGIPVLWTQHGISSDAEAGLVADIVPGTLGAGLRTGTWGYDIYSKFDVNPADHRIHKFRLSSFFQTPLELLLRGLGVDTLLITGVLTNQCVASTVKDAMFRDIKPIVVEEATGTTRPHLHEPVMEMIRCGWGQVNSVADTLEELGHE